MYVDTKNNMKSRSVYAVALGPLNEDGGFEYMSLETGEKITGFQWTDLLIINDVVERVEALGYAKGMKKYRNVLYFETVPKDEVDGLD